MVYFEKSDALKRLPKQFFADLVVKTNAAIAKGYDVINLGQGNPDQPTPPHIVKSLQEAAANPLYHKYSPFRGYDFLKEAIAAFYKREYDVAIDPKTEVAILFGSKTGLVEIGECILNSGDTVLMPDPGYPDYLSGFALANLNMETMPLRAENAFLPDYASMPDTLLDKAKLMFLNYPNNPTSATAPADFFEETVKVAEKHNICVLHDFAYGALGFDGKKPRSFLQTPGAKEVGIETYTLSKTYNMAGWRVGFALGNKSIIEAIELFQDHYFVSLFGAIQEASAKALLGPQDCVRELVQRYETRRNAFFDAAKKIGWNAVPSQGSFFGWLPVAKGFTSESFFEYVLDKAHVVLAPGVGFGKGGENYVRIGLLSEPERLTEAVERIGKLHLFD
ncbi:pyridoxal phosphate-dependent aminotransferase [Sporolactobacillus inulinus]|jgi:aminotransferase|uniref:Aminotransferase n=1 Tax=Sporolactobacillus inulinus CASD TaxID=1069536 RepID=A0A0U1QPQ4_9BACL|nr:pyridoxal phosphate-dependent aminotransferase [Sporolactobacillus inulinus]KLI02793.1 aminotransferase [Sporolactobacillus inulinus CASD]GEB77159.1 diaminopimelate aminotransferase [Sporolactobacillus inulinus]